MKRFFRRFDAKGLISAILAVAVIVGVVAGVATIFGNETKKISPGAFSKGALDAQGEFVKSDTSLVTKESFECIGLCIEQDFESGAKYDVYYYEKDGDFLESRIGLKGTYDEDFPFATYARVVIHPAIPEDMDSDDFKIRFWETRDYANDLKITVNKDQTQKYETGNILSQSDVQNETSYIVSGAGTLITGSTDSESYDCFSIEPKYKNYDIYVKICKESDSIIGAYAADSAENGKIVYKVEKSVSDINEDLWVKITLNIKDLEKTTFVGVNVPMDSEICVFGYN